MKQNVYVYAANTCSITKYKTNKQSLLKGDSTVEIAKLGREISI